jgi:stage II sporulation protein P
LENVLEYESENISQIQNSDNLSVQENLSTMETETLTDSTPSTFSNLQTEVISSNNLSESFNVTYGSVKIKNETSFTLDESVLNPDVSYTNKSDILIFHTHTCESYTPTETSTYTASGNFRTTDLSHSVAQVGTILSNELLKYNYNIIHSLEYHDYPNYNGSYNRSLTTVTNLLKQNSPELVIDLHRDAVGSMSNYAPSVKIGDETVAQLMFVIGTNGGGLSHDNWRTNLKFAIKIQEKANELFPGLFRPIIVRNSRYNQHLTSSSVIIEVGATGNTLEQATRKYEIFGLYY